MNKLLLKNGTIVSTEGQVKQDLLVENGKILAIGQDLDGRDDLFDGLDAAKIIDCTGKHILPGAIDVHVHLREPGATNKEDFRTGTMAAIAGGVTTVFDMPNNNPPTIDAQHLAEKRALIKEKAVCNVGLYALAVPETIDEVLKMDDIVGVKIYLGASTGGFEEDISFLEEIFKKSGEKIIVVHAEDGACIARHAKEYEGETNPAIHSKVRASECASMATRAVCELAKKYNARVHIAHMSTAEEVAILREFHSDRITCEVTPHHLFLTSENYAELGNRIRVNPPVREQADVDALWGAINEGIVDMVATDHAPHTLEEKAKGYWDAPSGMPGLETMLPLMLDAVNKGRLKLEDLARICSFCPAKVFGWDGKGQLKEGMDADITIVDMKKIQKVDVANLKTKCAWSPFEGWELKGWPIMTIVGGEVVFEVN